MIKAIHIPASPSAKAEVVEVNERGLTDYYNYLDGGPFEVIEGHPTGARMYANKEGHLRTLGSNPEATTLFAEAHAPLPGGTVFGGILITGPVSEEWDTSVPDLLLERFGLPV